VRLVFQERDAVIDAAEMPVGSVEDSQFFLPRRFSVQPAAELGIVLRTVWHMIGARGEPGTDANGIGPCGFGFIP
jgi:hypothetical protein